MSAGAIIESILEPITECLTPAAAERLLQYRVDKATQTRVAELAERTKLGTIGEAEHTEYRELVEAFDLVAILKIRARKVLAKS